jgi:hypothetical protein
MGNHAFQERNGSSFKRAITVKSWVTFRETVPARRRHINEEEPEGLNDVEMTTVATTVVVMIVVAVEMIVVAVDSGIATRRISRRLS